MNNQPQRQIVIIQSQKSAGVAAALAFFFGPIGMIYATPVGAMVMFLINLMIFFMGFLTFGLSYFLFFLTWPAGVIWAWTAASDHNRRMNQATANYMNQPPVSTYTPVPPMIAEKKSQTHLLVIVAGVVLGLLIVLGYALLDGN